VSFTVQEIKERDAALIVMESEPPSDRWLRMWEDWFANQAGEHKAESVHRLFHYARLGVEREQDVRAAAKVELAEMLESLARQIRPIAQEQASDGEQTT
jgi:hypothetical protein